MASVVTVWLSTFYINQQTDFDRYFVRPLQCATTTMNDSATNATTAKHATTAMEQNQQNASTTSFERNKSSPSRQQSSSLILWGSSLWVWPAMILLPLVFTTPFSPFHYTKVFPIEWYSCTDDFNNDNHNGDADDIRRKPLGLILGISAVAIGQVGVWIFFFWYKYGYLSAFPYASSQPHVEPTSIQTKGSVKYEYLEGLMTHISQPEGFVVLTAYLSITWMFNLMPNSYYQFTDIDTGGHGSIQYKELFLCLVIQDALQYAMHRLEHDLSPTFYQKSHKPHHKFLNPRLFDAFNGSLTDTICMIIIPLFFTAHLVRTANVWTYMAFGSTYACWLTLIHSEYVFVWDPLFRCLGFGTPADHHVHHAFFKYNYGHLFMWFDQIAGTYHNPNLYIPKHFNVGV